MFDPELTDEDAVVRMAENTYKFYEADENGYDDGCQIAVYNITELEGLAAVTRDIYETVTVIDPWVSEIQRYNKPYDAGYVYDMDNLMEYFTTTTHRKDPDDPDNPDNEANKEHAASLALLEAWQAQWRKVVVYGAATRNGIGNLYIYRYCGLGSFAIDQPSDISWRGYNTLQWWEDVVSVAPAYLLAR